MRASHAHRRDSSDAAPGTGQAAREVVTSLIWLVGLSHASNHLAMLIFPAVLLLVQAEFGLSYAELGFMAGVSQLCYGLGALPAGLLADRFGGTRILAVWLAGSTAACIGIGLSTGLGSLAIGLALLGICASLHHPAASGLLVSLRKSLGADVGRAFGRLGILGNVGLAAAPLLSAVIGAHWGWRAAFWTTALPQLLLAWRIWNCRIPSPLLPAAPPSPARLGVRSLRRELTLPLLILFGFETLMGFIFQGFSTFLPTYLAGAAGIGGLTASQVQRGGSLASLALLFGGMGHLAAGRLMKSPYRGAIFLATVACNALSLLGMGVTQGAPLLFFGIALSLTHFALSTMSNTFMAFQAPSNLGGTAFGFTFTLSFGVGSLASSSMGLVAQRFGLSMVFIALGGVGIGGVAMIAWFGTVTGAWFHRRDQAEPPRKRFDSGR